MTIDVEDYFHVAALAPNIDRDSWGSRESRVLRNTQKLLDMFEQCDVVGRISRDLVAPLGAITETVVLPGPDTPAPDDAHAVTTLAKKRIGSLRREMRRRNSRLCLPDPCDERFMGCPSIDLVARDTSNATIKRDRTRMELSCVGSEAISSSWPNR